MKALDYVKQKAQEMDGDITQYYDTYTQWLVEYVRCIHSEKVSYHRHWDRTFNVGVLDGKLVGWEDFETHNEDPGYEYDDDQIVWVKQGPYSIQETYVSSPEPVEQEQKKQYEDAPDMPAIRYVDLVAREEGWGIGVPIDYLQDQLEYEHVEMISDEDHHVWYARYADVRGVLIRFVVGIPKDNSPGYCDPDDVSYGHKVKRVVEVWDRA